MKKQWRVGILGLGHWYSAYGLARALAEHPRASLVAVTCPDESKRESFASTFGIAGYATVDELLALSDVDVVHICPPVADIPEYTIKAATAGKHLVLGKPMAMSLSQADAMVSAVRRAGVRCMPFQGMYRIGMADLKRRLADGIIGDIILVHSTGRWGIAEDWFRSGNAGWFADPVKVPGGAFIDEGIYGIDQLCWLVGSRVTQVEAKIANFVHKDIPVEDWGFATFTFENGVVATLEASWTIVSPRKTGPSPKHNSVNRLEIVGTAGEMIQDSLRGPGWGLLAAGAPGWIFERSATEFSVPPSAGPMQHLLDCLDEEREPVASIEDARAAFALALAAYESARSGKPVQT